MYFDDTLELLAEFAQDYAALALSIMFVMLFFIVLIGNIVQAPVPPARWKIPEDAMEVCIQGDTQASDLWYHVKGEGHTVILLHGAGTSSNQFSFLFKRLSTKKLRIVAIDFRGHGLSGEGDGFTARSMASDIQKVMDNVGGAHGFTLVGCGLGGYGALAWRIFCTKDKAKSVTGMVLISTFARIPINWTHVIFQALVSTGIIHLLWRSKSIANTMTRVWFGRVVTPTMLEELRRSVLCCRRNIWARTLKACEQDLSSFLPHIDTPCLIICGKSDVLVYSEQSQLMFLGQKVGVVPQKATLEHFGHVLAWEAPDKLTALICGFILGDAGRGALDNQPAQ